MVKNSITRRTAVKLGAAFGISHALPSIADETMLTRPIPGSDESLPVIGLGTYSVFDVAGSDAEIAERRAIVAKLMCFFECWSEQLVYDRKSYWSKIFTGLTA